MKKSISCILSGVFLVSIMVAFGIVYDINVLASMIILFGGTYLGYIISNVIEKKYYSNNDEL